MNFDIEFLQTNVERLESVFLNILYMNSDDRIISPDINILGDLKNALNNIFEDNKCLNVLYTINTDKPFFGVRINPAMSPKDAVIILSTEDEIRLCKYQIELDSKLFELGLSAEELSAYILFEVSSMMDSNAVFDQIRAIIDYHACDEDMIVNIRDSVNYSQLVIFAIKDTMYKLSSLLFKESEDEIISNYLIQALDYQDIILSANNKILNNHKSTFTDSARTGKTVILEWMFFMIQNMKLNRSIVTSALKDAKQFTGSKLEIAEIDKTINSIDHIGHSIENMNESINKFFDRKNLSALNEISIFKNLKKNGLRGLENELYEFAMRVKNCDNKEDAYLIIRGLNSRIGILEDYIANENLSEYDNKHWTSVLNQYKDLRYQITKKKFKEKQFGLWYDYSKFDNEDNQDE